MVSENKVVSRIPRFTGKERKILRRNVENRLQISPEDPSAVEVLAALNEFEKSMPKTSKKKASRIKWEPQPSLKSCGRIDGKAVAYIFKQESDTNNRNSVFSVTVLGTHLPKRLDNVREAKQIAWDHYQTLINVTKE